MRGSWLVARSDLRRRWRSAVALTILVGLVGALVLAALAGARRTSSAFDRFREESRAPDLTVFIPTVDDATIRKLRALPGVEAMARARAFVATVNNGQASVGGPLDGDVGRTVGRRRVLEGRLPVESRAREVAVPESLARVQGIAVGDTLALQGYTQSQLDDVLRNGGDFGAPSGPEVRLRVVGITRSPNDLAIEGSTGGVLFTTRQFVREYGDRIGTFAPAVLLVRLRSEDAARAFVRDARALVASKGSSGEFQVQPPSDTEGAVQQSIDVVATGLLVFAGVLALAGVVAIAIALRRFVESSARDLPALRGLGLSRRERLLAVVLPVVPIALGAAVVGVIGAWLASPLMPMGLARQAEPHLGFDVDGPVLGLGLLALALVVGVIAWLAGRRSVRLTSPDAHEMRPGTSAAATAAVQAGCPPPVTVGVTMALEPGRGRTAVPVRPGIAGALVAVVGVVAVAVFGADLAHLVATPAAYGYNWDTHFTETSPDGAAPVGTCLSQDRAFTRDRAVAAAASICSNSVEVDGHPIGAYGFVRLVGTVGPTVLQGRVARGTDEVALGTDTLARVHKGIGDRVKIAGPEQTRTFRVVGRVVLPWLGNDADVQSIADGAVLTGRGLARLSGPQDISSAQFVVRWRPGTDVAAARKRFEALPERLTALQPAQVPLEVKRLDQLDVLPWILGACLALVGVLGIAYALVTGVRRRTRDLAVLMTMGFRRRQVIGTVATQATVYAVIGLVLGIPLGIVVGRVVWRAVADDTGLVPAAPLPWLLLLCIAVATLLIVNLVALLPARAAAQTRPAVALRSE